MTLKDSIARIREIAATLPDDDPDKIELLNTEGDYSSLMEWALQKRNEHLAHAAACASLVDVYAQRGRSFAGKADTIREIVSWIMSEARETKYTGPSATVSIRAVAPKPIITDEKAIPAKYKKTTVSIDKTKINAAIKDGESIPGVSMDNGGSTISIRSK